MPLPPQIQLSNTFGQWINTTNQIITATGNSSEYILVAQNATPQTSSGNVSVNGTITVVNLTANGIISGNGVSLSSLNASALATGTVPLGRLSSANTTANGVVDTTTQSFAGNKTFTNNVEILGYLTVGNNTITLNSTTLVLGNSSSNLVFTSAGVTKDGTTIIDSSGVSNNALNLNSQPASYYTNASNLSTGTVPLARLSSANTVANGVVDTTTQSFAGDKTFTNNVTVSGTITGNVTGTASNATNLNSQPGSYYTNASNLSTGTVAIARLDANVILTTSTTGINASALSTGIVPVERLSAANTTSNGVVTNTTQSFAGNKTFNSDVTITGNLTIIGTETTLNVNNVIVTDSLIQLAANNLTSDALDIGLYGNYNGDGGAHEHTGLFRDASDGIWKLFVGLQDNPTTTVNTAGTGYAIGTLQSYLLSTIFQTSANNLTITANSSYPATLTVNAITATTLNVSDVVALSNTLSVTGSTTLSNTLSVTGAANALGTLGVGGTFTALGTSTLTGAATLSNTASITGAVNALSTLGVGGAFTALGTSTLTGAATLSNTASITGAVNALSTLGVGGVFTALATSTLTGAVTMSNTVSITGAANALSTLGVGGTFTALGTSTLTGAATLSNTASITGAVNALSTLGVGGAFSALSTSAHTGSATFSNTVTVTGTATMNGIIDANNKLTLNTTNGRFVLPVGADKWAT